MKSWAENVTWLMEGPNWPFRCSDMLDNKLSQLPTLSQCFHLTSYKCGIKSSHVTVSVLVHLCHDDIAGLCFLSMWNNKDIKSRSNPRLCTHTLPPPFLSPIKKKPNSQKKLNMAVYLKIPSEMEVAPRYNCLHCWHWWHYLHCLHYKHCLHCWHGLSCWHGFHSWHGTHCTVNTVHIVDMV